MNDMMYDLSLYIYINTHIYIFYRSMMQSMLCDVYVMYDTNQIHVIYSTLYVVYVV